MSVAVGFHTDASHSTTVNEEATLSTEMTAGFEFAGLSEEYKISSGFTSSLEVSAEATYGMEAGATIAVTCEGGRTDGNVGAWQWVTETSSKLSRALTMIVLCRSGAGLYNTQPACPISACADEMCTYCVPGWYEAK